MAVTAPEGLTEDSIAVSGDTEEPDRARTCRSEVESAARSEEESSEEREPEEESEGLVPGTLSLGFLFLVIGAGGDRRRVRRR